MKQKHNPLPVLDHLNQVTLIQTCSTGNRWCDINPSLTDKYMVALQLLGTSCWYRDNCITKLWALSSYFLYLYMVFIQHCFRLEQHCFHLDRQFSCSSNIPILLIRVPTKSSIVIQNSCSSWLSYTLPPLLHKCSVSVLKSYHNIFHSCCYIRLTYILSTNVCQLQNYFTPINFVHLTLFSIPYKMNSLWNMSGMFVILAIISHAHSIFTIQDNLRSFL